MKKPMVRALYTAQISYPAEHYPALDYTIYGALKTARLYPRRGPDTGMGFGYRDIYFTYATLDRAKLAISTLKPRLRGKRVTYSIYPNAPLESE